MQALLYMTIVSVILQILKYNWANSTCKCEGILIDKDGVLSNSIFIFDSCYLVNIFCF